MAPKKPKKKVEKAPKAAKAKKKGRRETRDNPGAGHNLETMQAESGEVIADYLDLSEKMASDMAGYAADFATLYEKGANTLGMKSSVLQKELKRILAKKKAAEKEAEMAKDEREQTEMFRAAQVGGQYEMFAEGDLAAPSEKASEEQVEEAVSED